MNRHQEIRPSFDPQIRLPAKSKWFLRDDGDLKFRQSHEPRFNQRFQSATGPTGRLEGFFGDEIGGFGDFQAAGEGGAVFHG